MTDPLPEPLVPIDCDCTDLDGFMLNVERLMASELVALSSHEVVGAALFLWCRAWKQRPAASLPDDDRVLAAYARLSLPRFRKMRHEILRGFVKCSDGRLYHKTLGAEAMRSFGWKRSAVMRRERDAERLRKWRETHQETPPETPAETRFVREGQDRTGQDKEREDEVAREGALPVRVNGHYAFAGMTIRLTQPDFDRWAASFAHLSLAAELEGLDHWAGTQGKNWFNAVAGALAKKERQAVERLAVERERAGGRGPPTQDPRL